MLLTKLKLLGFKILMVALMSITEMDQDELWCTRRSETYF